MHISTFRFELEMDVAQAQIRTIHVADVVGDDCQRRFQNFLERYSEKSAHYVLVIKTTMLLNMWRQQKS